MDLDDVVPAAEYVTKQSRVIDAPPSVVWEELHRLQLSSLPVTLLFGAVRALPVLLSGKGRRRGELDRTFLDVMPIPLLASDPPRHVVFGGVLQAWRLFGGKRPPSLDAAGVREWSEPGWVKVGMEFRLTSAVGGTRLSCETRVAATDAGTRRRFTRYWFVVRPGSSAIRWELLTAVAMRAEDRARQS
jgi:hypothetical protein